MLLREGLNPALLGVGIGLLLWLGLSPVLSRVLGGLSANPGPVYLVVASLLVATAQLACWLPARRAMRVIPVEALRAE